MNLINTLLIVLYSVFGVTTLSFAADISPPSEQYQSTFDDYKPIANESLSDWKSINVPSESGGHAGHTMPGMDHSKMDMGHDMSQHPIADRTPTKKGDPTSTDHSGMDHSKMNHSTMDQGKNNHNDSSASESSMDHSKMPQNPNEGSMQSNDKSSVNKSSYSAHDHQHHKAAATTDHSHMTGMDHTATATVTRDPSEKITPEDAKPKTGEVHNHDHDEMSEMTTNVISPELMERAPSDANLNAKSSAKKSPWIVPNWHPAVVHFPIALTLIAFVLGIAAHARWNHPSAAGLAAGGHLSLWLAALTGGIAIFFGWLAFNSVNHDDAGHAAMLLHRAWAIPTGVGLIVLASWDAWKHRLNELMSVPVLLALFLLAQSVAVTGWLGGEVVFRHGIGVVSMPSTRDAGHSHEHGTHTADEAASSVDTKQATEAGKGSHEGEGHAH